MKTSAIHRRVLCSGVAKKRTRIVRATLAAIGRQNSVPPRKVYDVIRPAALKAPAGAEAAGGLPESPPPGTGNLTLADLCARFNLNLKKIQRELKKQGVAAPDAATLKTIAADHDTSPVDLYERIRTIANN